MRRLFFCRSGWTDPGSGTAKSLRAHLTRMSGSQDLRCRPLSIVVPLENCADTPAAHLQKHAVESTSFAGQLLLTQQYRAVVDGHGRCTGSNVAVLRARHANRD